MWIQKASLFHFNLWEGDEANDPRSSFQIYKEGDWEQSAYIYEVKTMTSQPDRLIQ